MAGKHRLTERKIKAMKPGQTSADGAGLYLQAEKGGSHTWSWRRMIKGENYVKSLGGWPHISMEEARATAERINVFVKAGGNPDRFNSAMMYSDTEGLPTVGHFIAHWLEDGLRGKSDHTQRLWRQTLQDYAWPIFEMRLDEVTVNDIADKVLAPIWFEKNETARRVQNRLSRILGAAKVRYKLRENPAIWKDNLNTIMNNDRPEVQHHRAMEYDSVPDFYAWLEPKETRSARAWQVLILTGLRQGELRRLQWDFIDLEKRLITVPAQLMKRPKNGDHMIPISDELMRVLDRIARTAAKDISVMTERDALETLVSGAPEKPEGLRYVFPGTKRSSNGVISETAMRNLVAGSGWEEVTTMHGLRTSMRDWMAEVSDISFQAAEMCLHHLPSKDKTVRAYLRTKLVQERTNALGEWGTTVCRRLDVANAKPGKPAKPVAAEIAA